MSRSKPSLLLAIIICLAAGVSVIKGTDHGRFVSSSLSIDRSRSIDPNFFGRRLVIDEEDDRSLTLTRIDLSKIDLEDALEAWEASLGVEEKITRLKHQGFIRLDAGVLVALLQSPASIPEHWKGKFIFFDGTIFRQGHSRYCACLHWSKDRWTHSLIWLSDDESQNKLDRRNVSAVISHRR